MPDSIYEQHIKSLYKILAHEGSYSQLHCHDPKRNQIVSRELKHGEEEIIVWAQEFNGKGNCYIGRTARDSNGATTNTRVLTLDIDPIREKDAAATEEQWAQAIQAGRNVLNELHYGVLSSSGNGALVIFPLKGVLGKNEAETYGKALEAVARKVVEGGNLNVRVDSTYDHSRLIKLLGTLSVKGDQNLHRQARFLDSTVSAYTGHDAFISRVSELANENQASTRGLLPEVSKGELDRSKADFVIALRLQTQGFSAEDTYRALCEYSTRPGREDDAKRIVNKLYSPSNRLSGSSVVSGGDDGKDSRPVELWTPANGLEQYKQRATPGTPELPTGFGKLDTATFGLMRGHIFTIAARTNGGKTTFATTVAASLCRLRKRVVYLSTENQFREMWDRYFAVNTGISGFQIQNGLVTGPAKKRLEQFIDGEFKEHQFLVYDGGRPNLEIVKKVINQSQADVLIYDYFQHSEGRETRELEEFVMQLKEIAKEKQIAILMCAQLHDGPINPKTNKLYPPKLGDMKSCKVLNDESRVVVLLDWDRDGAVGDGAAAVKLLLAKNKGPHNDIVLKLDRAIPMFVEG